MIQRESFQKIRPNSTLMCAASCLPGSGWMSPPWPGEGSLDKGPAAHFPLPGLTVKAVGGKPHSREQDTFPVF